MIRMWVEGKLPAINVDLEPAFETISDIMFRSVQQNFIVGGRPEKWPSLREFGLSGSAQSHLYQSGHLFESIQLKYDGTQATVFIDTARVPYASILNSGGVIRHPGSDKLQVFHYNGSLVFTQGTKPHNIPIPKRQYMMFQEEDKTQILEVLRNALFPDNKDTTETFN